VYLEAVVNRPGVVGEYEKTGVFAGTVTTLPRTISGPDD
jgi:hypothetical protein